jgi:hypothetical protein
MPVRSVPTSISSWDIVSITVLSGIVVNLVSYLVFLTGEGAFIVTVLKATGEFTSSCTRFISLPFTSASATFTVTICISTWMIGWVLNDTGLGNRIAIGIG